MPYTPPDTPSVDQPESASTRPSPAAATASIEHTTGSPDVAGAELAPGRPDPHEKRQVRLTAQRILGDHLRDQRPADRRRTLPPAPKFWRDMDLDLTGATLIDLDFNECHGRQVSFATATFTGATRFDGAIFTGDAGFDGAIFQRGPHRVDFHDARVRDLVREHVWPPGWTMQPNGDGTTATLTWAGVTAPSAERASQEPTP
jgi:hypothetical protein